MHLNFSAEDEAFRTEVRQFIEDNYPSDLRASEHKSREQTKEEQLLWHQALASKGWAVPLWPKEFGGTGWTPIQYLIFMEEIARGDCWELVPFGPVMVAPVIIKYGTEEQQQRFLPDIRDGKVYWCQGYSEPGAGSDLASLRTKAELITDDDGKQYYLVNGQKTWTTMAQHADWIFLLVRTSTEGKLQEGITFLLVDMKSEGITRKKIETIEGGHEVNDTYFDNVKVPVENRIGEENKGWTYAKALLAHERTSIARIAKSTYKLEKIKKIAAKEIGDNGKPLIEDPIFRRKLTEVEVDLEALRMTERRTVAASQDGKGPGPESSIFKIRGTEIAQRIEELAVEVVGYDALPYVSIFDQDEERISYDAFCAMWDYLNHRKTSIYGGSNEIQRNIISKAVLGLKG
jgi:alkylation response protein AidB-like acyl-CoA dehydrogenase